MWLLLACLLAAWLFGLDAAGVCRPDPLRGRGFVVTGAACDPTTGACFQKGSLQYCEGAWDCAAAVRIDLDRYGHNITWVIYSPTEGVATREFELEAIVYRWHSEPRLRTSFRESANPTY
jgi:hypothetical protein